MNYEYQHIERRISNITQWIRVYSWKMISFNSNPECVDIAAFHPDVTDKLSRMYEKWAERAGVRPWDSLILAGNL